MIGMYLTNIGVMKSLEWSIKFLLKGAQLLKMQ